MVFNPGTRDAHGIYPTDTTEVDGPSGASWFELFANLNVSMNNLATAIDNQRRVEQEALRHVPLSISFDRSSQPAGATDIQDFSGPQPGREWVVNLLTAITSPLAANAAVVTWYVGQIMPGPAAGMLPAAMFVWQFASIPAQQTFNKEAIQVKPGEHLIAGLTGVPASSTILLGATITDQFLYDTDRRRG